jgi:hypothetical protein
VLSEEELNKKWGVCLDVDEIIRGVILSIDCVSQSFCSQLSNVMWYKDS